jgi:hypothetical protein
VVSEHLDAIVIGMGPGGTVGAPTGLFPGATSTDQCDRADVSEKPLSAVEVDRAALPAPERGSTLVLRSGCLRLLTNAILARGMTHVRAFWRYGS